MAEAIKTPVKAEEAGPKFPEMEKLRESLKKERSDIIGKSATFRQQRETLLKEIQPLESKLRKVDEEIAKIERPRLAEIDMQLGRLAVATGGRSVNQPEPK